MFSAAKSSRYFPAILSANSRVSTPAARAARSTFCPCSSVPVRKKTS
jgi:hypothetical protein